LEVTSVDGVVVIAVSGLLDAEAGAALVRAARHAAEGAPTRLDIDLQCLDGFTDEGAAALVTCRDVGNALAEGLHYRTGRGAGRDALLAAYAR
ncbi:MAG TPA: hypothetical protein VGB14_18875, partial [Acidimicrobiales bacterium]